MLTFQQEVHRAFKKPIYMQKSHCTGLSRLRVQLELGKKTISFICPKLKRRSET